MVVGAGVIVARSLATDKENRAAQEEQQGCDGEVHSPKESVCLHCSLFAVSVCQIIP
jgi:hypothetical protein